MAPLLFIFGYHKHIFLMTIQILWLKKHFSSNFETLICWTWLTPDFLALWEIYILITHWWLISISKTSNGVEWGWMMPHDVFFLKSIKSADISKRLTWKVVKRTIFGNSIISFQWRVIHPNHTSGSEIRNTQMLETKNVT